MEYIFEIVKKFIFKKIEQNTNTLSNDDILEWILKNSSYKTNLDIPVNFNFKNIEDPDFLNWDINCECSYDQKNKLTYQNIKEIIKWKCLVICVTYKNNYV